MKTQKEVVEKIIEWSLENSSGTIVSRTNIEKIVSNIFNEPKGLTLSRIEDLVESNESARCGFLIKASDIVSALPFNI
jgi:uncharacterized alkaline shock family protein YloU